MSDLRGRILRFLFPRSSDRWLFLLRVGLGAQVVLYCLLLRGEWSGILSQAGGLIDRRLPEIIVALQSRLIPQVSWLVWAGEEVGLAEGTVIRIAWFALFGAGLALIAGLFSRLAAVLAWFLHLCAAKSGGLFAYGADNFMTIGLFYLMLAPHPDGYSLDARIWRRRKTDLELLGFFRRLLQLHLCVIYLFSGLSKALGGGWWDGSNLWRALTRPPFEILSPHWLASFSFLLPVAGVAVWAIELFYPVFIWGERTRLIWLLLICGMHLVIALSMGMVLFGLIMIVLNLAAFAPPREQANPAPI